jgi:hypothetical protein
VTTGAGTTVTGGAQGIHARNYGSGTLRVDANGDVTGTNFYGIYARNDGLDLIVTTGAGTDITGGSVGIRALNYGTGMLTVPANGDVEGTAVNGIYARNSNAGTDVTVTTGVGTTVTGSNFGISARIYGSGGTTVTANGDVIGTAASSIGIIARNAAAATGDLKVTTGAGTTVTGGLYGILTRDYGSGALTVTANGDVGDATTDITASMRVTVPQPPAISP